MDEKEFGLFKLDIRKDTGLYFFCNLTVVEGGDDVPVGSNKCVAVF